MKNRNIRMAFFFSSSSKSVDPASITSNTQYNLLRNIYGRLVEYNSEGQLVAGVPDSFESQGKSVTFFFGRKAQTIDGNIISARDAEISLKRLIIKGKSGHGDIRWFLCPNFKLAKVNDPCPGILREGNRLTLSVEKEHYLPLLISHLASADFSILLEHSLDPDTLEIQNHRNTSGPYFVEKDSDSGEWLLRANPKNYLYDQKMPQTVQLVPSDAIEGMQRFQSGDVDLLPTTSFFSGAEAAQILTSPENEVHESVPIKVSMLFFSPSAVREYTAPQRLYVARAIAKVFSSLVSQYGAKPTRQFFQNLNGGALSELEFKEFGLENLPEEKPDQDKPFIFKVTEPRLKAVKDILKESPGIKVVVNDKPSSAFMVPPEMRPLLYYGFNDSLWSEDIGFLGYNFENKIFNIPNFDYSKWMEDYLSIENKAERISKLKKLQILLLKSTSFFPIEVTPYYAVMRKPWRLNQATTEAGTRLWRIRLD